MIIQRKVNVVSTSKTLEYSEIGDVICEGSLSIVLPSPKMGLWYTLRLVTDDTVSVNYLSGSTQIKLNEEATFIASDSVWYMTKGGSSGGDPSGGLTVRYQDNVEFFVSVSGNSTNDGLTEETPVNDIDIIFNRLSENAGSEIFVECDISINILDTGSFGFDTIREVPGYNNTISLYLDGTDIYIQGLSIERCASFVEVMGNPDVIIDEIQVRGCSNVQLTDINFHTGANPGQSSIENSLLVLGGCTIGKPSSPLRIIESEVRYTLCTFLTNTDPIINAIGSDVAFIDCDLSATTSDFLINNSNYEVIDMTDPGIASMPLVRAPKPEPEKVLMTDVDGIPYWGTSSGGGTIPLATTTNDGLMSSGDKALLIDLDSIAHEHGNIAVIEELSDIGGSLAYLGTVVGGGSGGAGLKLKILTSDFAISSTTMSDVSELAFTMEAGKSYKIDVVLRYRTAATTTGGKFGFYSKDPGYCFITGYLEGAISASAAATALKVPIRVCYGKGDADSFITTTGVSATNKDHIIHGTCFIVCEDTGTFQPCWGSEVNSSAATLMAGSMLSYQEVS